MQDPLSSRPTFRCLIVEELPVVLVTPLLQWATRRGTLTHFDWPNELSIDGISAS